MRADGFQPQRMARRSAQAIMEQLALFAKEAQCGGLAISFAGWIDADGQGISAGPNIGWGNERLVHIANGYGLACHLENDLDARAWGEWTALTEEEQSQGDLLVINAGSGFALGLVVGGKLLRGARRRAGEIGHIQRRFDATTTDCIERILGGAHHTPGQLDDPAFQAGWLTQATQVLAPVITAFDPAHIVATGGILDNRPELMQRLNERLIEVLPPAWWGALKLEPSVSGEERARIGVIDLAQRAQSTKG
jgi:predicted NBD/HSP70 family sugar kinase